MRRTSRTLLALLLAAMAAPSLTSSAQAAAPKYVPSGWAAQQFAATHMAGKVNPTSEEAVALAQSTDVILATRGSFAGQVTAMKQANARLRILDYVNAAFAQTNQAPPYYPDAWYARDANGALVRSKNFGNYLMDITNPSWGDDVAARCKKFVAGDPGYDGCFLDMLGTAPIRTAYLTSQPINTATGRPWTDNEWIRATTALARKSATANPNLVVGGNGLATGSVYFSPTAPTSQLWPALTGAEAEVFVRNPSQGVTSYRTEAAWKADVDMLVDAGKRGEAIFAMTKLWVTATADETTRWHKYALATFLLGTNGASYFRFSIASTYAGLTARHPYERVDLGAATSEYGKVTGTGVYRRNFTKGLSLVNPTASAYTVALGGSYRDLDGATRTSITLAPHSGEVFVNA
jgi:hypothetical protein